MFIVGLTGGIGSGKTAASDWFAAQGITVVDADVVAREVVMVGQPALLEIAETFGHWVLQPDGTLDRAALRQHVFLHPQDRQKLEKITHARIHVAMAQQLQAATSPYVILVSPLLLESGKAGLSSLCQRILVVDVPEEVQRIRAGARDGQTLESIDRIMAVQIARTDRLAQADDVAVNDGELTHLYQQLRVLHAQYLEMSRDH
ncbi:dephospho-CoA kinase [Aquirhabdus parva]|uniref:Dephospho-CoA kinase n=1 Tax=Aquirhabdus parva TaxID=2283318 RepID=A0A345PAN5_9GAMM|nr:dephospho-CoA kinase [Aquirhabdus parva]AXI04344.1 dephospho-CoA kinase [Aquirhabdus parva]